MRVARFRRSRNERATVAIGGNSADFDDGPDVYGDPKEPTAKDGEEKLGDAFADFTSIEVVDAGETKYADESAE